MSEKYIMYHLIVNDVPGSQFVKPFIWWFDLSCLLEFVERYKIDDWYIVKAASEDDETDKIIARSKKYSENLTSYLTKKGWI